MGPTACPSQGWWRLTRHRKLPVECLPLAGAWQVLAECEGGGGKRGVDRTVPHSLSSSRPDSLSQLARGAGPLCSRRREVPEALVARQVMEREPGPAGDGERAQLQRPRVATLGVGTSPPEESFLEGSCFRPRGCGLHHPPAPRECAPPPPPALPRHPRGGWVLEEEALEPLYFTGPMSGPWAGSSQPGGWEGGGLRWLVQS